MDWEYPRGWVQLFRGPLEAAGIETREVPTYHTAPTHTVAQDTFGVSFPPTEMPQVLLIT